MAQNIRLRHAQSGVITTGFYGFSWTTLFFSGFPAASGKAGDDKAGRSDGGESGIHVYS